ncbi:MAG: hypothetical protein DHS20C18_49780 [Saprospiraceae bacterium]|nr:MAG: hypothetical protein DHS20C18_49780 [Saprospiraceae bacterium]
MKGWYVLCLFVVLFSNCKKEDQAEIDRGIILQYIEDKNLDAIEDPTGLFYVTRVEGTGEHPTLNDQVTVVYKGFFLDGTVFDQTEPGQLSTFGFSNVIQGWRIGIPKMKEDGEATLIIPSRYAYGRNPPPGIPVNAVLVFDIRLVAF